jgi:hypothetical protein
MRSVGILDVEGIVPDHRIHIYYPSLRTADPSTAMFVLSASLYPRLRLITDN